jgi:hypothetical protein
MQSARPLFANFARSASIWQPDRQDVTSQSPYPYIRMRVCHPFEAGSHIMSRADTSELMKPIHLFSPEYLSSPSASHKGRVVNAPLSFQNRKFNIHLIVHEDHFRGIRSPRHSHPGKTPWFRLGRRLMGPTSGLLEQWYILRLELSENNLVREVSSLSHPTQHRVVALRIFVSKSVYTVANPTPHKDVLPDAMINFQVSKWQDRPKMLAMVRFAHNIWRTFVV